MLRRLKAATAMLMLIIAARAAANCWTFTDIRPDGRIITCTICCTEGLGCTRTCM